MVALPFLITTATVIYAVLYPPEQEGRIESSKALSSPLSSRIDSFWIGVGVGISLSWLTSYEIRRRRLWQQVRLKFLSWLYDSDFIMIGGEKRGGTPPLLQKFRTPCQISQLDGTKILRKSESEDNNSSDDSIHGTHLELVSPDWALSSNLYIDVVRLPPGTELVSKNAEGVEFYYVMQGDGRYVDHNGEKHEISAEDGFIVDPECNRGFLVEGTTDGLVLLRATDIVASAGNSNLRKLQTSSMTSTVAIIKAGVNKIYQLIQKHAST